MQQYFNRNLNPTIYGDSKEETVSYLPDMKQLRR